MAPQVRPTGRPRKFDGPSKAVTLTLPQETIDKLTMLDPDRARAIVHATDVAVPSGQGDPRVEVISVAPGVGMLTVPTCRYLEKLPGLSLAQIVPGRFLIVLTAGTTVSDTEVAILDQLERVDESQPRDRAILEQLLTHLRQFRRSERVNLAEVILVAEAPGLHAARDVLPRQLKR
jgi:hypothetical protein